MLLRRQNLHLIQYIDNVTFQELVQSIYKHNDVTAFNLVTEHFLFLVLPKLVQSECLLDFNFD